MRKTVQNVLGAMILAAALGVAGCASTEEREAVSAAQQTANEAMSEAQAARADAAEAKQLAQEALETARQALEQAQANEERIDRMFKESMQK